MALEKCTFPSDQASQDGFIEFNIYWHKQENNTRDRVSWEALLKLELLNLFSAIYVKNVCWVAPHFKTDSIHPSNDNTSPMRRV